MLSFTLLASLLDSSRCWTESSCVFPTERTRRSTMMPARSGAALPEEVVEKNTHQDSAEGRWPLSCHHHVMTKCEIHTRILA